MTVGKLKALLDGLNEDAVIGYVVMTDYGQDTKYAETEVEYIDAKMSVSSGTFDDLCVELIVATDNDGIEIYKNRMEDVK
jgi:SAM-dependent MidA family methyltransferase